MGSTMEKRMLKKITSLMVFILFIAAGGAQAEVSISYSSGGKQYFSIAIPDEWRVNVGSEYDLSQKSGDNYGTGASYQRHAK